MDLLTLTLPAHWASYIINDDATGLEPGEKTDIDYILDNELVGHCVNVTEEQEFVHYHDARQYDVLPADCLTYTFERRES